MRLNKGLEAIVLFVQGALAGLTLASIYMMALAENLESFVGAYEVCKGPFKLPSRTDFTKNDGCPPPPVLIQGSARSIA